MAGNQKIHVAEAFTVDGQAFKPGQVVGEMQDGKAVPTVTGLTRGNVLAGLRARRLHVGDPKPSAKAGQAAEPSVPGAGLEPPYTRHKQADLLAEVNRRRQDLNRNVAIASEKKADLVAALEADDEQLELEAEANANEQAGT